MAPTSSLTVDRLDDLPLLLGLLRQLHLDTLLEAWVGTHGNTRRTQTLGNGMALVIWLSYILSAGDHRKVVLADWVAQHTAVLSAALGEPVLPSDFSDDRLSTLLARLQQPARWQGVEAALLGQMITIYDPGLDRIHLDPTTVVGYHAPDGDGLMRLGFAKTGPSGLAQVKLMAATSQRGQVLACAVVPGNQADPPLYPPMIRQIRRQVGAGRLYVGDSKLGALATRADLVAHGDQYLTPLARTDAGGDPAGWLAAPVPAGDATRLLWRDGAPGQPPTLLGGVRETARRQAADGPAWDERLLVVYGTALAQGQTRTLRRHLRRAREALLALTRPPKRGRPQFREETAMQAAVTKVLQEHGVTGLLQVQWQWEAGTGRTPGRYVITAVTEDAAAVTRHQALLGWRVLATNAPAVTLPADAAVLAYREEYVVERCFHLIKDQPVGIRPLWVRTDEQIRGLAYLLTLAVRVLVYLEHRLHDALVVAGETLSGLHPGQSHVQTDHPTATRVLATICRHQPTRVGVETLTGWQYRTINVTPLLQRILQLLALPDDLYTHLNTS